MYSCQAEGGICQSGEGPLIREPLEAQSDYWFPLTADPVALQHRRYFGFQQPDVLKKKSLARLPDQAVWKHSTRRVESRPMPETRIGTNAFTIDGCVGSFYPPGIKLADYLPLYRTCPLACNTSK